MNDLKYTHAQNHIMKCLSDLPVDRRPSNLRSGIHLFILTSSVILGAWASAYSNLFLSVVLFVYIGILQYHIAVATHEAIHFGLLRPPMVNDLVGNILCATITLNLKICRRDHLQHHRAVGASSDPEIFPYDPKFTKGKHPVSLLKFLVFDLTFKSFVHLKKLTRTTGGFSYQTSMWGRIGDFILLLCVHGFMFIFFFKISGNGWNYFIFWVCPLFIPAILTKIRSFGEHGGLADRTNRGCPKVS